MLNTLVSFRSASTFEAQGLQVTPFPVGFQVGVREVTVLDVMPEAEALENTSLSFREALRRAFYALKTR